MPHPVTVPGPTRPGGYVLTLSCSDQPGIVRAVAEFVAEAGGNIAESQQFGDPANDRFFMRVRFTPADSDVRDTAALSAAFAAVAAPLGMTWRLSPAGDRQRVLIMVSKFGHCLNDLLFRAANGGLNIDVVGVVSNHPDLGGLADHYGVPFHHIPVSRDTKPEAEAKLMGLVDELGTDLVVLARYMQILSPDLCENLRGRAINIHHSMLPAFKGARPYFQAYDRGVKLVGATAHYVTSDLDEGPIIEQEVARVGHEMTAADVTRLGRDTECLALSHAVRWHTENRVLLDGKRTVVFS